MTAHLRTIYGVTTVKNKHRELRRLKKESHAPELHGHQVWQSSYLIMDYLAQNPLPPNQTVMDAGCGWGLLGIHCAKTYGTRSLLIDADIHVLPYVELHQQLNGTAVQFEQLQFTDITEAHLDNVDLLLGADICFWSDLQTQLKALVDTAARAGVGKVIIADPGRLSFMQLVAYCTKNYHATLLPWSIQKRNPIKGQLLIVDLQA